MRAENAPVWLKDALAGIRDALPWCVVIVGGWAALQLAPSLFYSRAERAAGTVAQSSPWISDLVGKQVSLPERDLNGRPVPHTDGTIVWSVACSECSSPEALLALVRSAPTKPVVLVSAQFTPAYRAVLDHANDVVLVQCSSESSVVPVEMLSRAPQVVVLDSMGVIRETPRGTETLKMFFERLGGKQ